MKKIILAGATDQTLDVFIQDSSSTTGAGLTGLAYNTASLVCYYRKGATGSATALSLATQTVGGAHSDGGFVEIDATNMPGMYRLDLPDTIVAAAGSVSMMLKGATNMAQLPIELQVVGFNPEAALATPTNITAGTITTTTNLTNLPAITSNWLTAAGIASGALDGKGNWNIGKTGYALTATTGLGNQTADITGSLSGSVGSVTGAVGSVTGAVGSVTGLTASDVGAIKTKTDSLTFTVAGQVDANIQYVNDVAVTGDGGSGTEWGPA